MSWLDKLKWYYIVFETAKSKGFRSLPHSGELNIAELKDSLEKEYEEIVLITSWKEISGAQHNQLLRKYPSCEHKTK